MKLEEFYVETWMTDHENDCLYNLTDTCVTCMSLNELQQLCNNNIIDDLMNIRVDYGPIVGSNRLKNAVLGLYETGSIDNLTMTTGAINANELVLMTLLNPGDSVLTMLPTYQQLYSFPASLGCSVDFVELKEEDNWLPNIEDFKNKVSKKTKLICLNSPNNPTGTFITKQLMLEIIDIAKENDCYILCDEVYRGTIDGKLTYSVSDLYDKAITTGSLSKVFSFAGLRLGWVKGPKEIIDLINYRRDYHIICNGPIDDYLASVILENKDLILKRSEQICIENKSYLKEWLKTETHMSCVVPEYGTVGFLKYDLPLSSIEFCERLQKEEGIFFVPGSCFNKENHVRFGFGNDPQTVKKGLAVLSRWLKQFDEVA
ncbi:MAG: aminotransferase class I/II-fold pyridoxal phosphate-dependent enzyme [Bacilli bacterium]|nr:aminotransferase class I/II-fold pyridoxal phosphate-dependent enzyme [Bacilli bacterium]